MNNANAEPVDQFTGSGTALFADYSEAL